MPTKLLVELSEGLRRWTQNKNHESRRCLSPSQNGRNCKARINNQHPLSSRSKIILWRFWLNWYSICVGIHKSAIFITSCHFVSHILHHLHSHEFDQCKESWNQDNFKNINFGHDSSLCMGNRYHHEHWVKITYELFWFFG